MTLRELFQQASNSPSWIIYYFLAIPILSFILLILFKNPNTAYKVKWLFSILVFSVVLPGVFSLTFNIYTFLFERQSILDINLAIQVLPIISMLVSLYFIKRILPFEYIPGFEKLTTISSIIFGMMAILWIVDRTHIFAISIIPFGYILIGFIVLVLFFRYGLKRLF